VSAETALAPSHPHPTAEALTGPATDGPDWDHAWAQALTDLEVAADEAERLLSMAHLPSTAQVAQVSAWRPPHGLGPLPYSLKERAEALVARQRDLALRTAEAARMSRRQARVADQLSTRPPAVPVYLDAEG
jgi:hypothetical protein